MKDDDGKTVTIILNLEWAVKTAIAHITGGSKFPDAFVDEGETLQVLEAVLERMENT